MGERLPYVWSKVMEPLNTEDMLERGRRLQSIVATSGYNLKFYVFRKTEEVISVGIKGKNSGMWIFDANSLHQEQRLDREGFILIENETDMMLDGDIASIEEINKWLPSFLARYYPQLATHMDINQQQIVPESEAEQDLGQNLSVTPNQKTHIPRLVSKSFHHVFDLVRHAPGI